mgnify:CR=1 FL=1
MSNIATVSAKTETSKKVEYNGPKREFSGLLMRTLVKDVDVTLPIGENGKSKTVSLQEVVKAALREDPNAIGFKLNCDKRHQKVSLGTVVVKRNDDDYGGYQSHEVSMTRMAPEMIGGSHRKTAPTDMNGDPKPQSEVYRSFIQFT